MMTVPEKANAYLNKYLQQYGNGGNGQQPSGEGMMAKAQEMKAMASGYMPEDLRGKMQQAAAMRGERPNPGAMGGQYGQMQEGYNNAKAKHEKMKANYQQQRGQGAPQEQGPGNGQGKAQQFLGSFLGSIKAGMNPGESQGMSQNVAPGRNENSGNQTTATAPTARTLRQGEQSTGNGGNFKQGLQQGNSGASTGRDMSREGLAPMTWKS